MRKDLKYSPLRFLASLGNGGMVVTFFLYLNFLIPLKGGAPIIDFYSYFHYLQHGSWPIKIAIVLTLIGVLFFSYRHLYLLFENFNVLKGRITKEDRIHRGRELMALPLTIAMAINVMFMLGSLFVPGLWGITEYLFPFAIAAFLAVGIWGLRIFLTCFSYHIQHGDKTNVNNFSRLIPPFAFSMVAVGLAAAGAMSHLRITAAIGSLSSMFFLSITLMLVFIQLTAAFTAITREGLDEEGSSGIWILIPILTVSGIAMIRHFHFFDHHLGVHIATHYYFLLFTFFFSIQIFLGILGYVVMKNNGYFKHYVRGNKQSFGSYALICPGVAFFVFGMFFIQSGLIKMGLVTPYSYTHFGLIFLLFLVQVQTILTLFRLDKK